MSAPTSTTGNGRGEEEKRAHEGGQGAVIEMGVPEGVTRPERRHAAEIQGGGQVWKNVDSPTQVF